jgi:hypothetical protein
MGGFKYEGESCSKASCPGHYHWSDYCGAYVCTVCGDHRGLSSCYCGWNKNRADPEARYQEGWDREEGEEGW